jgi:hypothetical protein
VDAEADPGFLFKEIANGYFLAGNSAYPIPINFIANIEYDRWLDWKLSILPVPCEIETLRVIDSTSCF